MKTCGQCKWWKRDENYMSVGDCSYYDDTGPVPMWAESENPISITLILDNSNGCKCFSPREPEQGKESNGNA